MKSDRGLLVPISMMLVIVLTAWLGIAGAILDDTKANGLYTFLSNWQTVLGALIALAAALVAVRPVWQQVAETQKQVAETRKQSALQTLEHLRNRSNAIEHEQALTFQAQGHVGKAENLLQSLRSVSLQHLLEVLEKQLRERIKELEGLSVDLERAGYEHWGSIDVVQSRGEFSVAIAALISELSHLLVKVLEMRHADATQWTAYQALLEDLKEPTVLEEKGKLTGNTSPPRMSGSGC